MVRKLFALTFSLGRRDKWAYHFTICHESHQIKEFEIDENVKHKERVINSYRILFGEAESMRPFGSCSCRYV
jgi:hypothetical protein